MAQLVARLVRNEKVGGSNPPSSTAGQRTATALPGRSGRAVLRSRRGRSAPPAAGALRTAVAARSRAQVGRRYGFASGPVVGRVVLGVRIVVRGRRGVLGIGAAARRRGGGIRVDLVAATARAAGAVVVRRYDRGSRRHAHHAVRLPSPRRRGRGRGPLGTGTG